MVDDNEVNRAILAEQMEAWRFDSASATNGLEALAVLRAAAKQNVTVDCVVLDYHMPGMNGGDVVMAMRRDPAIADIPVVMLTSVDQTEDGKTFSSLGIEGHLTKPARSALLLETIVEVLEEHKARVDDSDEATKGIKMAQQLGHGGAMASEPEQTKAVHAAAEPAKVPVPVNLKREEKEFGEILDVLVCEDNQVNQIVFSQILESAGYSYLIAEDGEAGVTAFEEHRPRLVPDGCLHAQDERVGSHLAIRLLEAASAMHTPIIGVTAHAIKGDMEKCLEAGMDDYLSKPVSPDRLHQKIARYLSSEVIALEA